MRVSASSLAAFAAALLSSCASPRTLPPKSVAPPAVTPPASFAWTTTLDRDHPLVGRIWDVKGQRFVPQDALEAALASARVVLLGEKHDNPDHHRLQGAMIDAMVRRGRHPAVALEMLGVDEQPKVDEAARAAPGDVGIFFHAVDWDHSGWPPSAEYAPVIAAALSHGLPIIAANLPTADVKALVHQGLTALDPALVDRLGLATPMPAELAASLHTELVESHCGMLPERMFEPMMLAQRARDAEMADRLLEAGKSDGAVLVAGSGHARVDRGVPRALATHRELTFVTLAFAEVSHDERDPGKYASVWHVSTLPFDFVWFTPRATDEDPCKGMKAR